MYKTTDLLRKYHFEPKKYTIVKSAKIIETDQGSYVIKPKHRHDKQQLYEYLSSRSFDYFPAPENDLLEDEYEIYPFIEEITTPKEQKAIDLIYMISLLHNKTTFYKEIDLDDIKNFYEETLNRLNYLEQYYFDLQNIIEGHVYMSPSEYLLIRNMSKIYSVIYFCKHSLESWYHIISKKKKERFVLLHNNLELDHLIKNKNTYLISWDKAKADIPIYDFYHFYKKHYLDCDFISLFQIYESKYPLLKEEKILLFLLLSIPEKVVLEYDEYENCRQISNMLLYLDKTSEFISKQNPIKSHEQTA